MLRLFWTMAVLACAAPAHAQAPACKAPVPVCDAAADVFAIASFDPVASAVRIAPGLLVTNRHAVADNDTAEVILPGGKRAKGEVVPTAYPGDLILVKAPDVGAPSKTTTGTATGEAQLYNIGADIGRGAIRVYAPGKAIALPIGGKPLSRIHHDAESQPCNSGGAVIDGEGRLVGIVASGGEGRNEAIPAAEIEKLKAASGPEHAAASRAIGKAYRQCTETVEAVRSQRGKPREDELRTLVAACTATGNRQMMDVAGQTLGGMGKPAAAIAMFEKGLEMDPMAPNGLLSLVVALGQMRRQTDALPYLKRLMEMMPTDLQVLRLSIHAGKFGNDRPFADKAMALLEKHHPKVAPAARRFLEAEPRR